MKKLLNTILVSFLMAYSIPLFSQMEEYDVVYDVTTPTGVAIDAYKFDEVNYDDFNSYEITYYNYVWTFEYNCRILANSTKYYNCHGYAWHNIEGRMSQSDLRWINDVDGNGDPIYNVTKYYTGVNRSYDETATISNHLRVSYFPRDHSAVTTEDEDSVISKWAWGPLVKHTLAQCPFYSYSQIKYYKLFPGINGSSSELCIDQERTFTSNTSITGSTYSWTRDDYHLDYVSGAGTTDYRVKAKNGNLEAWVRLQITTPSGEVATTSKKYFWVGKPYVNPATIQFNCVEGSGYLCTNAYGNQFSFSYTWPYNYFDVKLTNFGETQTLDEFTIYSTEGTLDYPPPEGTYKFMVRGNNDCGTATNWSKTTVDYVDCGGFRLLSLEIFPNPAADETIVSIVSSNEEIIAVDDTEEWDLEVYTQSQLLKLIKRKIKGPRYTLNTSGWQPGIYFMRVNYKDEILTKTLVVNK